MSRSYSFLAQKCNGNYVMEVLAKAVVIIILQDIPVSDQHIYFMFYVSYISKLGKKKPGVMGNSGN